MQHRVRSHPIQSFLSGRDHLEFSPCCHSVASGWSTNTQTLNFTESFWCHLLALKCCSWEHLRCWNCNSRLNFKIQKLQLKIHFHGESTDFATFCSNAFKQPQSSAYPPISNTKSTCFSCCLFFSAKQQEKKKSYLKCGWWFLQINCIFGISGVFDSCCVWRPQSEVQQEGCEKKKKKNPKNPFCSALGTPTQPHTAGFFWSFQVCSAPSQPAAPQLTALPSGCHAWSWCPCRWTKCLSAWDSCWECSQRGPWHVLCPQNGTPAVQTLKWHPHLENVMTR